MITPQELFDIIKNHIDDTIFDEEALNYESCYKFLKPAIDYLKSININIYFGEGVSKAAMVCKDADFVFKIPFEEEDNKEVELDDLCSLEVYYYEDAIIEGVEDFFAETKFFDYIKCNNGKRVPVYYQKKVEVLEDILESTDQTKIKELKDITPDERKKLTGKSNDYYGTARLSIIWIKSFIDYYGEMEFEHFGNFIDEHNINDLHNGNVGYIGDRPVVFDFSGYEGSDF